MESNTKIAVFMGIHNQIIESTLPVEAYGPEFWEMMEHFFLSQISRHLKITTLNRPLGVSLIFRQQSIMMQMQELLQNGVC